VKPTSAWRISIGARETIVVDLAQHVVERIAQELRITELPE